MAGGGRAVQPEKGGGDQESGFIIPGRLDSGHIGGRKCHGQLRTDAHPPLFQRGGPKNGTEQAHDLDEGILVTPLQQIVYYPSG